MRKIAVALALALSIAQASAQGVPNYPQTLPANSVVGRLGASAGPTQAIPFATLAAQLNLATQIPWANITNKPTTLAGFGITSPLPYNQGGTNANLTAVNGGVVYSDASKFNILAPPVSSGLCLLSSSTTSFSWASCAGASSVASVTAGNSTLTISPTSGAVVASVNVAATSDIWSGTASKVLDAGNVFNGAGALTALGGTASAPTVDLNTGFNFTFTATTATNYTLQNPTNATKVGQTGCIFLIQPASGSVVTIAYSGNWKFSGASAPSLTATLGAVDMLCYIVRTSTFIVGTMTKDVR